MADAAAVVRESLHRRAYVSWYAPNEVCTVEKAFSSDWTVVGTEHFINSVIRFSVWESRHPAYGL